MFGEIFLDHCLARSGPHRDAGHFPAFGKQVAGGAAGHDLCPVIGLLLDRRLHPAKSVEILFCDQRQNMHGAATGSRAARGKTQRNARLVRLVHDHQIDPHSISPLPNYPMKTYSVQEPCPLAANWPEVIQPNLQDP